MNIGYVFLIIMAGAAYFVSGIPTPDQMIADFKYAQKFYTSGAYDQAIEKYEEVGKVESRFVDEDKVIVELGGLQYRIKDATLYQTGNSYSKMAEEELRKLKETKKDDEKDKFNKLAIEYIKKSDEYFTKTQAESDNEELKVLSQKRVIDTWYIVNDYEKVILEGRELIEKYPKSTYVQDALYNIGWAYYETKDYEKSVETFKELISRFPTGNKSDRALFQIGECLFDQKQYSDAAFNYNQLVNKMRINELTDLEIQKIQRDKLAGLTDETALDLAAKAALKVGACYANSGDYTQAAASYKRIASLFKYDKTLIYEAYSRLANMYLDKGDFNLCIQSYRDAIDEVRDKLLSAKMQVLISQRYFEGFKGKTYFENAITEYLNYVNNYSDIAARAGFNLDEAFFWLARSYHEFGVEKLNQNEKEIALSNFQLAINTFNRIFKDFPATTLTERIYFYMGMSYQEYGTDEYLKTSIETYNKILTLYPETYFKQYVYIKMAKAYKSLKDYDQAFVYYNKMLTEFPDSEQKDGVMFELARTYDEKGDAIGAVPYYLKVTRVLNKPVDDRKLFTTARLLSAQTLIQQNRDQDAIDALTYALEDTTAIESTYRLAQLYLMRANANKTVNNLEGALIDYTNAYNLDEPQTKQLAAVYRAGVYIDMNQFAKAETDLRELMKSSDENIKRSAQIRLAVISVRQGKSEQAIQTYLDIYNTTTNVDEKLGYLRNLVQLSAESKNWDGVQKYSRMMINNDLAEGKKPEGQNFFYKEEAYYSLANSYESMGDFKSSVQYLNEGFTKFPKSYFSSDMLLKIGVLYLTKLTNDPDALDISADYFERYIKEFPDTPNTEMAHYYLGFCYYNGRRFAEAVRVFKDFSRIYPNSEFTPEAIFYYSDGLYNLGNLQESIQGFDSMISRYPKHQKTAEALYTKSWAYLDIQKDDDAIKTFQQLLDRYPDSEFAPTAMFSIADYYYNKQQYQEAIDYYEKVLKQYPNTDVAVKVPDTLKDLKETVAYIEYEKGWTLFSQANETKDLNLYQQAIKIFDNIVKSYPGTESEVGAYSNMGICNEALGKWENAVKNYEQIIKIYEAGGSVSMEALNFANMHKNYIIANRLQ